MTKEEILLAAMSAANGSFYSPLHIQKLVFLIDERIPSLVGGPHFKFEDNGPFDPELYSELQKLSSKGFVELFTQPTLRWRNYRLTAEGLNRGSALLNQLGGEAEKFIRAMAFRIPRSSFSQLWRDAFPIWRKPSAED